MTWIHVAGSALFALALVMLGRTWIHFSVRTAAGRALHPSVRRSTGSSLDEHALDDAELEILRDLIAWLSAEPGKAGSPALLIAGPAGNGKPRLIHSIAAEAGVPVVHLAASGLTGRRGPRRLEAAFRATRQRRSLLFLEGIEALFHGGDPGHLRAVLDLLVRRRSDGRTLLAGTLSDPRLLELPCIGSSRTFDVKVLYDLPARAQRSQLIESLLRSTSLDSGDSHDKLTELTLGCAFEDLRAIVAAAGRRAARDSTASFTEELLLASAKTHQQARGLWRFQTREARMWLARLAAARAILASPVSPELVSMLPGAWGSLTEPRIDSSSEEALADAVRALSEGRAATLSDAEAIRQQISSHREAWEQLAEQLLALETLRLD